MGIFLIDARSYRSTDVPAMLHLGCLLLQVTFWVLWTGSASTSLLDMCIASGGGPLDSSAMIQPCFHIKRKGMSTHRMLFVEGRMVLL